MLTSLLANIAKETKLFLIAACSATPRKIPKAASVEDSLEESPLKMVTKLVAVEMDGEVLGEAVGMANLVMAMEFGEGEVLVARPLFLLLKVMGIQTSATTPLKIS